MNNVRKMNFALKKHNTSIRALIIVQVAENVTIVKETVLQIHPVKEIYDVLNKVQKKHK